MQIHFQDEWYGINEVKKSIVFKDFKQRINNIYKLLSEYVELFIEVHENISNITNLEMQRAYNRICEENELYTYNTHLNFIYTYPTKNGAIKPDIIKPLILNKNPIDVAKKQTDYNAKEATIRVSVPDKTVPTRSLITIDINVFDNYNVLYDSFKNVLKIIENKENVIELRQTTNKMITLIDSVSDDINKIFEKYENLFLIP